MYFGLIRQKQYLFTKSVTLLPLALQKNIKIERINMDVYPYWFLNTIKLVWFNGTCRLYGLLQDTAESTFIAILDGNPRQ